MPARLFVKLACLSARRFKKRERRRKGGEQLCSWLRLPASVISIHCECKQTEPWKRKTWTEWKGGGTGGGRGGGGGRKQSASKNILARCVRATSSFTGITARQKHTLTGNTNMARRHTSSQRSLCGSSYTSISTCWTTAANKAAASLRIKWCDGSKPQVRDLPEGRRLHFR